MAKVSGKLGYCITKEDPAALGVWIDTIEVRDFCGDLIKNTQVIEASNALNDNLNINHQISIVSDPFSLCNCQFLRYVEFKGIKWKVRSFEINHPRIILILGGLYND